MIREPALQALDAAGRQGLGVRALAAAVSGSWQEAAVCAVVRKVWEAGELVRREAGRYVQSGRRAHDIRYREESARESYAAQIRLIQSWCTGCDTPVPRAHGAAGLISNRHVWSGGSTFDWSFSGIRGLLTVGKPAEPPRPPLAGPTTYARLMESQSE